MDNMEYYTRKFACYLHSTRAVSALEYAIVIGVTSVAVAGAYEAFRADIVASMTALGQQIGGGN